MKIEPGGCPTARVISLNELPADHIDHTDPEFAIRAAFVTLCSAFVLRTAYGPAFAAPLSDDRAFLEAQAAMVTGYLFR